MATFLRQYGQTIDERSISLRQNGHKLRAVSVAAGCGMDDRDGGGEIGECDSGWVPCVRLGTTKVRWQFGHEALLPTRSSVAEICCLQCGQ